MICEHCGFAISEVAEDMQASHDPWQCVENLRKTLDDSALTLAEEVMMGAKQKGIIGIFKIMLVAMKDNGIDVIGDCPITVEQAITAIEKEEAIMVRYT